MALSGIIPIVHAVFSFGAIEARHLGLNYYLLEAVIYISGAMIYTVSLHTSYLAYLCDAKKAAASFSGETQAWGI